MSPFFTRSSQACRVQGTEISLLTHDFSCDCKIQVPFLLGGRRHPASHRLLDAFHPISIVVPSPPSIPRDSAKNCLQLQYHQNIDCCLGDRFYPPLYTVCALRHPHYYYYYKFHYDYDFDY